MRRKCIYNGGEEEEERGIRGVTINTEQEGKDGKEKEGNGGEED
jgi:hypothetical protein